MRPSRRSTKFVWFDATGGVALHTGLLLRRRARQGSQLCIGSSSERRQQSSIRAASSCHLLELCGTDIGAPPPACADGLTCQRRLCGARCPPRRRSPVHTMRTAVSSPIRLQLTLFQHSSKRFKPLGITAVRLAPCHHNTEQNPNSADKFSSA